MSCTILDQSSLSNFTTFGTVGKEMLHKIVELIQSLDPELILSHSHTMRQFSVTKNDSSLSADMKQTLAAQLTDIYNPHFRISVLDEANDDQGLAFALKSRYREQPNSGERNDLGWRGCFAPLAIACQSVNNQREFSKWIGEYTQPRYGNGSILQDYHPNAKHSEDPYQKWYNLTINAFAHRWHTEGANSKAILLEIGSMRHEYAKTAGSFGANQFGIKRISVLQTPFAGYRLYAQRMQRFFALNTRCICKPDQCLRMPEKKNSILEEVENIFRKHAEAARQHAPMSELRWVNDYLARIDSEMTFAIREIIPGESAPSVLTCFNPARMFHTFSLSESQKDAILEQIDRLAKEARSSPPRPQQEVMENLAKIHWWLSQLTYFERGSASISEIFILSLAQAAGYPIAQWASDEILPDIEALISPLNAFCDQYHNLLRIEKPPSTAQ